MALKRKLIFVALIFWGIAISLKIIMPPSYNQGVNDYAFWAGKILWNRQYDMVITGDSRPLTAVSPVVMKEILISFRIANYSFMATCYSTQYMSSIENLLDPKSDKKVIVLAITAHSFTDNAARNSNFVSWSKTNPLELHLCNYLMPYLSPIYKYYPSQLMTLFGIEINRAIPFNVHYPDGWVSSRKVPETPEQQKFAYRKFFIKDKVSEKRIKELLDFVRIWRSENIIVFGFNPPVPDSMVEIEIKYGNYNEGSFVRTFEKSGGIWLDFKYENFYSYDGSHLRYDSAVIFSRVLARRIKNHMTNENKGQNEN